MPLLSYVEYGLDVWNSPQLSGTSLIAQTGMWVATYCTNLALLRFWIARSQNTVNRAVSGSRLFRVHISVIVVSFALAV